MRLKIIVFAALLLLAALGSIESSAADPKHPAASDQTATTVSRTHLKKMIWAQDQGGVKFPRVAGLPIDSSHSCGSQSADILKYFEELKREPNLEVGPKDFFEIGSTAWYQNIEAEWGGHLKATGSASWPDDRTWYQLVGTRTFYDGGLDFRLKNKLYLSDWGNFETHYEAIIYGGDTRRKSKELQEIYPSLAIIDQLTQTTVNDAQRLFDLTSVIEENDTYVFYHRLDRFALTWQPEWGTAKLGRQAVTWGNGFLFNPMDLFNPFAPTDVIRDYKIGVDLASILFAVPPSTDLQMLYVPRRDLVSGKVEWAESSLAGKLHFSKGTTEFDVMAAYHYQDHIVGIGSTGYLANAAWRLDATWTFLHPESANDDYLSLVANMDYSWVWNAKNVHGFIEYFYNGLGKTDYAEALTDPDIYERLLRGELFTFGRHYLSGEIQLEIHPLFNTLLSIITNIEDPSGVIQPRAQWDMIANLQCTMGANLYFGKIGTEYGGFPIPGTPFLYVPADRVYLWLTYYF